MLRLANMEICLICGIIGNGFRWSNKTWSPFTAR
jgi:hypothetical protein